MTSFHLLCRTALPLLLAAPCAAFAQSVPPAPAEETRQVAFSADEVSYDTDSEVVTASGNVRMSTEGNNLRADTIAWDRQSGEVRAYGNVRVANPEGDVVYGDSVVLTDLKDGTYFANLRIKMEGELISIDARPSDAIAIAVSSLFYN